MKLLKFDTLYPTEFINLKTDELLDELKMMSFCEYHQWLINLRITFSDYYTYNLREHGWQAEEFFLDNYLYKKKSEKKYFGNSLIFHKVIHKLRNLFADEKIQFKEKLIKKLIETEKPDVIFVREYSTMRSKFWEQFGDKSLLVCRMDCNLPKEWSPLSFDLIYTNIDYYRDFFLSNVIPTMHNRNGFDNRVGEKVKSLTKKYEVTYVGGLGDKLFTERTKFFEFIARESNGKFNFDWWGYKVGDFDNTYPELAKRYKGTTGGIDMFEIIAKSKIVLNYFEVQLTKHSYNMRIFEVMGVGTLLLAKNSLTFSKWENLLAVFNDNQECIDQIQYYLSHDVERESIAKKGQECILKNYNYKDLMAQLSEELIDAYNTKFKK